MKDDDEALPLTEREPATLDSIADQLYAQQQQMGAVLELLKTLAVAVSDLNRSHEHHLDSHHADAPRARVYVGPGALPRAGEGAGGNGGA
jgi:hypothetical protein